MKFSYLCTNSYADPTVLAQGRFPFPHALYDADVGAQSLEGALANARLADDLGFDWVSVSEHHYAPGIMSPNALVWAGALTQVVKRARIALLGPIVSINNPVRLAEEIAQLDMMSGGRILVFMLRGTPNEFNTYHVNPSETRERAQEAIKLIERALTEPQPFGWEGRYFRFPTVSVWPGPTQKPHPPIYSSGNSPESCVFAAQNHHGLAMSFIPPHLVAEAVALYKSECAKAGWEPSPDQILYRSIIAIGETEDDVKVQQQIRAARPRPRPEYNSAPRGLGPLSWVEAAGGSVDDAVNGVVTRDDQSDRAGPGFGLGTMQFAGTPDMLVEQIEAFYETTGVGVLDFGFIGRPEVTAKRLELFGTKVLPRVRHIGAKTAEVAKAARTGS